MDFDFTTETITPDTGTTLTVSSTGALVLPVGTTAQRPAGSDGMLRYNSDEDILEGFSSPYSILTSPTAIQRTLTYRKRRSFADEFLTGSTATNPISLIGELGWTQTSSGTPANSIQPSVTDHQGILRIATGATSGNNTRIHLGNAVTTSIIMANQVEYFAYLIKIPTITLITTVIGIGTDISSVTFGSAAGSAGVRFQFAPATSATFQFITRAANADATAVNTVTVVADTWYLLEAFYNGTTWTPVVNGVTYTAQTTNIPSVAVNVGALVQTGTTILRQLDIDAFFMITREMGVRY